MNSLFTYLLEINMALVILFVAYKIIFERDKNFMVRRIYLMGVLILPFLLPLVPQSVRMPVSGLAPISIDIAGVTVLGSDVAQEGSPSFPFGKIMLIIYFVVLAFGLIKLLLQVGSIIRAIYSSDKLEIRGNTLLSNPKFHASSFFKYIFIDPAIITEDSFDHILDHESIHKREWHSIDRILVELFVMINWFNPVAWMFRKSVIQNLEYLADSAVLRKGTDLMQYQLSILNQYIGSASISNQFSSQIKNRINMLNKDYKLGSSWKLILVFPLVFIAFFVVSCSDKDAGPLASEMETEDNEMIIANPESSGEVEDELFYIVEDMPTFNGGDPATEFRKYIAQNLNYPEIAVENGISGRVIVQFTVNKTGQVVDAVVVRSVNPALDKEALRVAMSSPNWTPGKQQGKAVKVLFTFPITFTLQ